MKRLTLYGGREMSIDVDRSPRLIADSLFPDSQAVEDPRIPNTVLFVNRPLMDEDVEEMKRIVEEIDPLDRDLTDRLDHG